MREKEMGLYLHLVVAIRDIPAISQDMQEAKVVIEDRLMGRAVKRQRNSAHFSEFHYLVKW